MPGVEWLKIIFFQTIFRFCLFISNYIKKRPVPWKFGLVPPPMGVSTYFDYGARLFSMQWPPYGAHILQSLLSKYVRTNIFPFSPRKLDGVGPVDNRPSTNKLHHFVQKKKKIYIKKIVTCDTWHVTRDTWQSLNQSMTRLVIEQPRLHRVC